MVIPLSLRTGNRSATVHVQRTTGAVDSTGQPTFGVTEAVEKKRLNIVQVASSDVPWQQPDVGTVETTYRISGTGSWPGGPYSTVEFDWFGVRVEAQQRGTALQRDRGRATKHFELWVDQMKHEVA